MTHRLSYHHLNDRTPHLGGRAHHMFHRAPGAWRLGSGDAAIMFAYILGLGFITCMFAVMETDWDEQGVIWFCCGGLAVVAMLISMVLRDSYEQSLCDRLKYFKSSEGPSLRRGYAAVPGGAQAGIMPRLTLLDILHST